MPGFNITGNEYNAAAIAGYGGNAFVIFTKPVAGNNTVRLASYTVAAAGNVALKDYEDFGNCGSPKITMLSATRAILAMRNQNNNHEVRVYDLDASGNITKKNWWASTGGGAVNPQSQDVLRLDGSRFVSAVVDGGTFRILSFTVNTAGTITFKDDDTHNMPGTVVGLARMSSNRVIVSIRTADNIMKVICYDVNESTGILTKRGEYQWNAPKTRISMVAFGGNKLACFLSNSINYLDITSLEVSTVGTFSVKQSISHVKIPGTTTNYELKSIDAQYDSGVNKIHLCSVRTSDKLNIIPFSFTSAGILTIEPTISKHHLSTTTFTHTSTSAASGLVINSSRQADSKYRIQGFKWGN